MKRLSKITESVWGDIRKRSTGETIKKEDEFNTNINELKPIDIGVSVLWADKDLEVNGDTNITFEQIKDFSKDGWRLPTRDEADELMTSAFWTSTKDPHSWQKYYKIGISHFHDAKDNHKIYFDCEINKYSEYWHSSLSANTSDGKQDTFNFSQDGSFYPHSVYGIANIKDTCRVRLVKDK